MTSIPRPSDGWSDEYNLPVVTLMLSCQIRACTLYRALLLQLRGSIGGIKDGHSENPPHAMALSEIPMPRGECPMCCGVTRLVSSRSHNGAGLATLRNILWYM